MYRTFTGNSLRWSRLYFGICIIGLMLCAGCTERKVPQKASFTAANKSTFTADQVTHFNDGDSMTLRDSGRVRLAEVDCPELHQKRGREAAAFTKRELEY